MVKKRAAGLVIQSDYLRLLITLLVAIALIVPQKEHSATLSTVRLNSVTK